MDGVPSLRPLTRSDCKAYEVAGGGRSNVVLPLELSIAFGLLVYLLIGLAGRPWDAHEVICGISAACGAFCAFGLPRGYRLCPLPRRVPFAVLVASCAALASASSAFGASLTLEPGVHQPQQAAFDPFLDDLEERTFRFFWETANPKNGLDSRSLSDALIRQHRGGGLRAHRLSHRCRARLHLARGGAASACWRRCVSSPAPPTSTGSSITFST